LFSLNIITKINFYFLKEHVPVHRDTSVIYVKIFVKMDFSELIAYKFATVMLILIIVTLLLDTATVNQSGEVLCIIFLIKNNILIININKMLYIV
jgi:hypothetical protein